MKRCFKCGQSKTFDSFSLNRSAKDGRQDKCKECTALHYQENKDAITKRNRHTYETRYGLPYGEYQKRFDAQDGKCALCGKPQPGRKLAVDHDHQCCSTPRRSCGKCVRGLLCIRCNRGLGQFQDDPNLLRTAASYIEMWHPNLS